ncbi:hypothetical protein AAG570_003386 [Ranatra chinensis]|uniref:Uncharacterized protein n=1 Tax=Ranatra chinensis TaxID=642074 RepID=A0ABD0YLJ3_9HEMI
MPFMVEAHVMRAAGESMIEQECASAIHDVSSKGDSKGEDAPGEDSDGEAEKTVSKLLRELCLVRKIRSQSLEEEEDEGQDRKTARVITPHLRETDQEGVASSTGCRRGPGRIQRSRVRRTSFKKRQPVVTKTMEVPRVAVVPVTEYAPKTAAIHRRALYSQVQRPRYLHPVPWKEGGQIFNEFSMAVNGGSRICRSRQGLRAGFLGYVDPDDCWIFRSGQLCGGECFRGFASHVGSILELPIRTSWNTSSDSSSKNSIGLNIEDCERKIRRVSPVSIGLRSDCIDLVVRPVNYIVKGPVKRALLEADFKATEQLPEPPAMLEGHHRPTEQPKDTEAVDQAGGSGKNAYDNSVDVLHKIENPEGTNPIENMKTRETNNNLKRDETASYHVRDQSKAEDVQPPGRAVETTPGSDPHPRSPTKDYGVQGTVLGLNSDGGVQNETLPKNCSRSKQLFSGHTRDENALINNSKTINEMINLAWIVKDKNSVGGENINNRYRNSEVRRLSSRKGYKFTKGCRDFFAKVGMPACRWVRGGQNKSGTRSVSEMSSQRSSSSTSAEAVRSAYHRGEICSVTEFLTLRRESIVSMFTSGLGRLKTVALTLRAGDYGMSFGTKRCCAIGTTINAETYCKTPEKLKKKRRQMEGNPESWCAPPSRQRQTPYWSCDSGLACVLWMGYYPPTYHPQIFHLSPKSWFGNVFPTIRRQRILRSGLLRDFSGNGDQHRVPPMRCRGGSEGEGSMGCPKVVWAVTKINIYPDDSRTYEVMKLSSQPPCPVPTSTDSIFVLVPPSQQNCNK